MARPYDHAPGKSIGGKLLAITLQIGKWLLIAALALLGLYFIGVNLVLNTFIGKRLMNSHPEVVRINFARAYTVWPGRIHVTGADISGQDSQNQFAVTAEHAAITFTPAGIRTKDVTGTNLRGDGITIRIRRRVLKMPSDKEFVKLPAIKGFPSPLKEDAPDVRVIGVRLQDIKATDIREIWVDGYHVTGDIAAEGGMYYKPRLAVRVYPSTIVIHDAKVITGEQPIASQLKGSIAVNVEEVDLCTLSQRDLALVSADLDLQLLIDNLRFANDMLPKGSGITLDDGEARVAIGIKIDKGVLADSSKLSLKMPHLSVGLPLFRAQTGIELTMTVDAAQKHAVLLAQLESLVVAQRSNGKADVRSKVIRLHGHTASVDLTKPPALELRVELPAVVAGDLTFANDFVPAGTAIKFEKGTATLSGHFNLSTARHRVDGALDIAATQLSVKNNSAHLWGAMRLHGLVNSLDLNSLSTDLSGTWLALEDVNIFYDGKTTPNWKARVDLGHLVLHPEGKHKLEAAAKVYLKNLQPAVGVIGANLKLPWIAKALAYRENVVADTHVLMENDLLSVTKLEVSNDSFIVQGQLKITNLQKPPPHKEGAILIKIAGLTIGIEIHDAKISPILVNAQKWFDERVGATTPAAKPTVASAAGAAMGASLGSLAGGAAKPVPPPPAVPK